LDKQVKPTEQIMKSVLNGGNSPSMKMRRKRMSKIDFINRNLGRFIEDDDDDWITGDELKQVKVQAKEIWEDFCSHTYEQAEEETWTEVEVNGKFFDIQCDDEWLDRTGSKEEMYCNVYPVLSTKNTKLRDTDGTRSVRLFTKGNNNNGLLSM